MALKGYLADVKMQSSSIVFTDEATTTGDDKSYTITDNVKDIWALDSTIVVKDNAIVTIEKFTISRLTGTITFGTVDAGRIITVSGDYVLLTSVAQSKNFTFAGVTDALDNTAFNVTGFRSFQSGLKSGTAELGRWVIVDNLFVDLLLSPSIKVIEYFPDVNEDPIRFFGLLTEESINANVEGLAEEALTFQITTEIV